MQSLFPEQSPDGTQFIEPTHRPLLGEQQRKLLTSEGWDLFDRTHQVNCPMVAALHKGSLFLFRSYVYSQDLNIAAGIVDAYRLDSTGGSTLVTGPVRQELAGTAWCTRLQRVDIGAGLRGSLAGIEVFHLDPP